MPVCESSRRRRFWRLTNEASAAIQQKSSATQAMGAKAPIDAALAKPAKTTLPLEPHSQPMPYRMAMNPSNPHAKHTGQGIDASTSKPLSLRFPIVSPD